MIEPIIILSSMGFIFGLGLFIASRVFHVKIDPRIERIEKALPGANCGACGLAGCAGFARAIVHGTVEMSGCIPGGEEISGLISDIMGVKAKAVDKMTAILHCAGKNIANRFEYVGIKSCRSAAAFQGGPKECLFGCIGLGDCQAACPFGAIKMVDNFPEVDEKKCVSCGKCVDACPKDLYDLHSLKKLVHVRCRSKDLGKVTRSICKVGCIACKKCQIVCPFNAINITQNVAVIDYEKCTSCGKCVGECPTDTILNLRAARKEKGLWPVKTMTDKTISKSIE